MKHLFVPYELALKLKDKGFNESCFGEYRQWDGCEPYLEFYQDDNSESTSPFTTECIAPMYQQVIDWFREKHKIHIQIDLGKDEDKNWYDFYLFKVDNTYNYDSILSSDEGFSSYYEVLNKAIEEALKLI